MPFIILDSANLRAGSTVNDGSFSIGSIFRQQREYVIRLHHVKILTADYETPLLVEISGVDNASYHTAGRYNLSVLGLIDLSDKVNLTDGSRSGYLNECGAWTVIRTMENSQLNVRLLDADTGLQSTTTPTSYTITLEYNEK